VTADSLTDTEGQASSQLGDGLASTPIALNLYLTVPVNNALPLLEPVKLPVDAFNLLTGANLNNPLATAVEPALTSLVNLGYTDVERKVDPNGVPHYDRTLNEAGVITPFGTLPSGINWVQVPGDLALQLAAGTETAFDEGLISDTPVVNPLATLAKLIGLGGLPGATSATSAPSPLDGAGDLTALADSAFGAAASAPTPAVESQTSSGTANALADNGTDDDEVLPTGALAKPDAAIKAATARTEAAAKSAQARVDASAKNAAKKLDKIAKDGQKQIQKVAKDVGDGVKKTAKAVSGAAKSAANHGD
jgi:hypothetical protein